MGVQGEGCSGDVKIIVSLHVIGKGLLMRMKKEAGWVLSIGNCFTSGRAGCYTGQEGLHWQSMVGCGAAEPLNSNV